MGFFDLLWGWADYEPKNWSGEPLSVEEEPTCFVVRDQHSGQKLATVYFEDQLARLLGANVPQKRGGGRNRGKMADLAGVGDKPGGANAVKVVVVVPARLSPPLWSVEGAAKKRAADSRPPNQSQPGDA